MAEGRVTDYALRWDALRAHVREALLEVSRQVATGEVDLTAAQAVARVWQAVDRLMDQLEQCPDGNTDQGTGLRFKKPRGVFYI